MRLKLEQVRLRNFRIHEDYTFTPEDHGVTAIIGGNGHGKSSIIDGVAWALFGTKPNGSLKNTDLRRIGSDKSDECFVEVAITIDGDRRLTVKREIKGRTVQCECSIDGTLEAGPAVSNADRWIPKTIGIDEEGFLSAILVQQKQVGAIVSESASVRQRSIEKLTGITAATNAVKAAREDANALHKAISMTSPDMDDEDDIKSSIESLTKDITDTDSRRDGLRDSMSALMKEYQKLNTELEHETAVNESAMDKRRRYDISNQRVKDMASRIADMADRITTMKKDLPTMTDSSSIQKELDDVNASINDIKVEQAGWRELISHDVPARDIKDMRSELDSIVIPDMDPDATRNEISDMRGRISAISQRIKSYNKSLKELGKGNSVSCPTCLQPIDDIDHITKEFNSMIATDQKESQSLSDDMESKESSLRDYMESKSRYDDLRGRIDDAISAHRKALDAGKRIHERESDLKSLESESRRLTREITDIKANRMAISNYEDMKREFEDVKGQYDAENEIMESLSKELSNMNSLSDTELRKMRKDVDGMRSSLESMRTTAMELKGHHELVSEKLETERKRLENAIRQRKERAVIMRKYAVAQSGLDVLEEFRTHLAKDAVPQITDYASDMISEITNGRFISVSISPRYDISVVRDTGQQFDVRMLSGGERDLVAICLRLAISTMLSGGDQSVIILDEVLTAMDDDMAASILTAIQNSGHGQVIIIAHNDIIKQIADKAVII